MRAGAAADRSLINQGGERELVLGVDDELLKESNRSIPRADVAELCVQSLSQCEAQNRCGLVPDSSSMILTPAAALN